LGDHDDGQPLPSPVSPVANLVQEDNPQTDREKKDEFLQFITDSTDEIKFTKIKEKNETNNNETNNNNDVPQPTEDAEKNGMVSSPHNPSENM